MGLWNSLFSKKVTILGRDEHGNLFEVSKTGLHLTTQCRGTLHSAQQLTLLRAVCAPSPQAWDITKHMNQPTGQMEATSEHYLEHAREINAIAGSALKLETRDATATAAKISLGLSLQAAELAGKAILRTLGHSAEQIRRQHRNHDLLTLMRQVEQELRGSQIEALSPYHHFLLWTPIINGVEFGNTIATYFDLHFSRGASALPRSYFYPDEPVFTGPEPIQSLFLIVEHLIQVAGNVLAAVEQA